jgi:hypothetical protein
MKHKAAVHIVLAITAIMLLAGCTSSPPKTNYAATFTEISESPSTQQGFVPAGKTLNMDFLATSKNITKVSIQLAFYDDSGDGCPDIMGLAVDSPFPNALYLPVQAGESNTTMTINVTIQHLPAVKKSTSKTELQEYMDGVENTQGDGKWTISIADVTASPCSNPKTVDSGNSWVLLISPFVFSGNITEA